MKTIPNLSYNERNAETLDLYLPEGENFRTVVFFHGGGFENGRKDAPHFLDFAKAYTDLGYAFASVNYSLYPNGGRYPDFIADAADAVKYISDRIADYGGNRQILISGQSAGGYLALMLCFNRTLLSERGIAPEEIAGWIIDSAQPTAHFHVLEKECGMDSRRQLINEYAPLYYLDGETRFSRMLLLHYEDDMPCRAEQNALLFRAIKVFLPDADLETAVLSGGHCHGSTVKNEDGSYDFLNVALPWLQKSGN